MRRGYNYLLCIFLGMLIMLAAQELQQLQDHHPKKQSENEEQILFDITHMLCEDGDRPKLYQIYGYEKYSMSEELRIRDTRGGRWMTIRIQYQ